MLWDWTRGTLEDKDMVGRHQWVTGVMAYIKYVRDKHLNTLYLHYRAHCLNLARIYSCEMSEVRNCLGKLYFFFGPPKRQHILQNTSIEKTFSQSNHFKLKKLCATQRVDRPSWCCHIVWGTLASYLSYLL